MKKKVRWILVFLIGALLFYIWFGFMFINPNMMSWTTWNTQKAVLLWAPRIFIPVFYGLILFLFFAKNKKLVQNITLLLSTLFICFLLIVPILYFKYAKNKSRNIVEQYHPYLQLKPKDTDILDSIAGSKAYTIFCLGGSTTEFKDSKGIGWPERLEKELRQKYNSDSIYVFNFGRQWYNTLHTLVNYETNLRHHRPDLIIIMHNVNDFIQNADFSYLSIGEFRQDYGHFIGPVVDIINTRNTGLIGRTKIKLRNMWYYNIPPRKVIDQDSFPGLESYARNLNTIIDLASLDGTKVVLMSQPNIYSENMDEELFKVCVTVNYEGVGKDKMWSYKTGYKGMKAYNERIRRVAEERNTYFIDLEKYIPKSLTYFTDEVHYTDTAFSIVGHSVASEITRLKIIPEPGPEIFK
jgi:hypothetical protein